MPDIFYKGKKISRVLWFSGAVLLVVLFTIVLILMLTGDTHEEEITETTDDTYQSSFSITDFYLDEELQPFFEKKMYLSRDPGTRWDKEEVDRFFIPADKILYEYFQKTNDNYSKEILSNIE